MRDDPAGIGVVPLVGAGGGDAFPIREKLLQPGRQLAVGAVAQHDIRLPQLFHLLREGLGIAARQHDDGVRMVMAQAANGLARLAAALRCDRTGIDHVHVRVVFDVDGFVSVLLQQTEHFLRFILIDLAAQGVNGGFHSVLRFLVVVPPCSGTADFFIIMEKQTGINSQNRIFCKTGAY